MDSRSFLQWPHTGSVLETVGTGLVPPVSVLAFLVGFPVPGISPSSCGSILSIGVVVFSRAVGSTHQPTCRRLNGVTHNWS